MSYSQIEVKLPAKPRNPFPVWVALALITLWWIIWDLDISFETLAYGVSDMAEYFSRYGQPDFSELSRYLETTWRHTGYRLMGHSDCVC